MNARRRAPGGRDPVGGDSIGRDPIGNGSTTLVAVAVAIVAAVLALCRDVGRAQELLPIEADCDRNGIRDEEELVPDGIAYLSAGSLGLRSTEIVPVFADLDGDGRVAVLFAELEAAPNGRPPGHRLVLSEFDAGAFRRVDDWWFPSRLHDPAAGDLDADGRDEVVVLSRNSTHVRVLRRSDDAGGAGIVATDTFLDRGGEHAVIVDSPSRPRVAVLGLVDAGADLRFLRMLPDGALDLDHHIAPSLVPFLRFIAADLDGDGGDDLVGVTRAGFGPTALGALFRDATGAAVEVRFVATGSIAALFPGDVDGDGDIDVLAVAAVGSSGALRPLRLFRNDGAGTLVEETLSAAASAFACLADVDGEGGLDVVYAERAGDGMRLRARDASLRGGDGGPSLTLARLPLASWDFRAADWRFDGAVDLVVQDREGRVQPLFLLRQAFATRDCDADGRIDACEPARADCGPGRVSDACSLLRAVDVDCDGNGIGDDCEIAAAPERDCDGDGMLDDCARAYRDCNGNGVADHCDIASGLETDCDGDLTPDSCALAEGDCDGNGTLDICERESGAIVDCDRNGVPDVCQDDYADCDGNGQLDRCQIASARSLDCDGDGVPDRCQLADRDCNANGVLDDCDVAADPSFEVFERRALSIENLGVADMNVDGIPDLIIRSVYPGRIHAEVTDGRGRFRDAQGAERVLVPHSRSFTSGDLNGDGAVDLAIVTLAEHRDDQTAQIFLNDGAGNVAAAQRFDGLADVRVVHIADVDGDGDADLLAVAKTPAGLEGDGASRFAIVLLDNPGNGVLSPAAALPVWCCPVAIRVGDIDADGFPDIVSAGHEGCQDRCGDGTGVTIYHGSPNGFGLPEAAGSRPILIRASLRPLDLTDLDGDGRPEIIIEKEVLWHDGDGVFARQPLFGSVSLFGGPSLGAAVDLTLDGVPELVLVHAAAESARLTVVFNGVHSGRRDRTWTAEVPLADRPYLVEAADFDGDGRADLAVAGLKDQSVTILLQAGRWPESRDGDGDGILDACQGRAWFHRGDVNGDGVLDIADGVALLWRLYRDPVELDCVEAADFDNDGRVGASDATAILGYLFLGGAAAADPGPPGVRPCGPDPDPSGSPSSLGCKKFLGCD